jgi:hypothetical protein
MKTRISCLLLSLAVLGAVPAASSAQATAPTGGVEAAPPSPFALSGGGGVMLGRMVRFRGAVGRSEAGRTVAVERRDAATGAWLRETTATVGRDGAFLARWRPRRSGRFTTRAVVLRDGRASAATASPELSLTVYKPALATWYGPGFFGRTTACGLELTREVVGVAHKRLPCGTQVAISHRGRSLVVPVIDRGPYRAGHDWDLTAAAAQQLGFTGTGRIGAVALR